MSGDQPWRVVQYATGHVYSFNVGVPDTEETARREARLAGEGHVAMPLAEAEAFRNGHAHGRQAGIRQQREADPAVAYIPVLRPTRKETSRA